MHAVPSPGAGAVCLLAWCWNKWQDLQRKTHALGSQPHNRLILGCGMLCSLPSRQQLSPLPSQAL